MKGKNKKKIRKREVHTWQIREVTRKQRKWNKQKWKAKKQEACRECPGNKVFWEQGQN